MFLHGCADVNEIPFMLHRRDYHSSPALKLAAQRALAMAGLSIDEIDRFEKSGYVMSGSRHARMNAVRIRKENQVYSAEEQRALALLTMEENQQKEAQLMEDFRTMLKEKQKSREEK